MKEMRVDVDDQLKKSNRLGKKKCYGDTYGLFWKDRVI